MSALADARADGDGPAFGVPISTARGVFRLLIRTVFGSEYSAQPSSPPYPGHVFRHPTISDSEPDLLAYGKSLITYREYLIFYELFLAVGQDLMCFWWKQFILLAA